MTALEELRGEVVLLSDLQLPKAYALATALAGDHTPYSTLIECRRMDDLELVVLEVDVERPQVTVHDIRAIERLAVAFPPDDSSMPEVWALRSDFPRVPHLNLHLQDMPRSLCLYDKPYQDLKARWTPERFIERIREWLAKTAIGELHLDDQPLEPILLPLPGNIFLPEDILEENPESATTLSLIVFWADENWPVLLARTGDFAYPGLDQQRALVSVHHCHPGTQSVVERLPQSFADLCEIAGRAKLNLRTEFTGNMKRWRGDENQRAKLKDSKVVIVLVFHRRRSEEAPPEREDVWAFLLSEAATVVGADLGLWECDEEGHLPLLIPPSDGDAGKIRVLVLNPSFHLTPELAATYGGHAHSVRTQIAAIGAGAIGSQVILNLLRGGFGRWTLIDNDILMPHNLARHALGSLWLGWPKALAVSAVANSFTYGDNCCKAIQADVLAPRDKAQEVSDALASAEIILDMSASVSVSKNLASRPDVSGRRIALFMSPTGRDLVVIAEGSDRKPRLDELEMQYYRAVAQDERLDGHLNHEDLQRRRYGHSCSDLSARIPQESVALHSALASRALRSIVASQTPRISIWRIDDSENVAHIAVDTSTTKRVAVGDWSVSISQHFIDRLRTLREHKLPRETGGVLLGAFDFEHRIAYIVDAIPSPSDSIERKDCYIRGCEGLQERVAAVRASTAGLLEYVGEWHSHPKGASTTRSLDDDRLLHWIKRAMATEGLPAMMLIVGDGQLALSFAPPGPNGDVFVEALIS